MKLLSPFCRKVLLPMLLASACLAASCSRGQVKQEAPADPVNVQEIVAQADKYYAARGSIENARQAVAVMRRARMSDYSNYEVAWKLSEYNYYLGEHESDENEKAKLDAFREGIAAGEAAVRLAPDKPDGHFWLGANRGGRAQVQGPLYALSDVPDIRREMETVIKLDEGYQEGSAYLALGEIDLDLPELMGGDRKRAVEELEKGLRFGEDNAMLRLRLAEAYYEVKRKEDARAQAQAILKMKPDPKYMPEYQEAADGARQLLKKLG
jgi:tetratricopeptide (TPR) repeat protein